MSRSLHEGPNSLGLSRDGSNVTVGTSTQELEPFVRDHERLSRQHLAQRCDRLGRESREVRERLVAHLAVLAKRAPEQVAPRLRRTGLRLVLAHHFRDMHRSIATCHKAMMTYMSFKVKYYLGYTTSSR